MTNTNVHRPITQHLSIAIEKFSSGHKGRRSKLTDKVIHLLQERNQISSSHAMQLPDDHDPKMRIIRLQSRLIEHLDNAYNIANAFLDLIIYDLEHSSAAKQALHELNETISLIKLNAADRSLSLKTKKLSRTQSTLNIENAQLKKKVKDLEN